MKIIIRRTWNTITQFLSNVVSRLNSTSLQGFISLSRQLCVHSIPLKFNWNFFCCVESTSSNFEKKEEKNTTTIRNETKQHNKSQPHRSHSNIRQIRLRFFFLLFFLNLFRNCCWGFFHFFFSFRSTKQSSIRQNYFEKKRIW